MKYGSCQVTIERDKPDACTSYFVFEGAQTRSGNYIFNDWKNIRDYIRDYKRTASI